MTFTRLHDTGFDAALDIIAPREEEFDASEAREIAAAYAAGTLSIFAD